MPDVISVRGLERRYGERPALSDVTFAVRDGDTVAVLGPNGAGKTTLLRVLAGLLARHAGEVRVLDSTLPAEAWKVRGRVGYLGHDPLLYRDLTARENLLFYARLHIVGSARVDELLARVGLAARADELVRNLSRGLVQRLAVARAILHDPPLLLLDEPREGLDPRAAGALEPLIGRTSGRTRVVVSHDIRQVVGEADNLLGLRGGRQAFYGEASDADVQRLYE